MIPEPYQSDTWVMPDCYQIETKVIQAWNLGETSVIPDGARMIPECDQVDANMTPS